MNNDDARCDPIDGRQMAALAQTIDELFNGRDEQAGVLWVLIATKPGEDAQPTTFVANSQMDDISVMIKGVLARHEGRYSQQVGHA